jgi:hypothetical protein
MASDFESSGSFGGGAGYREGPVARGLERQTAKIPSDVWLWAAVGSIGASLFCKMTGNRHTANFIGQWAPTFLLLGVYNKLVKLHGSDSYERARAA